MCGCVLLTGSGCEILGLPDIVILVIQVLAGVAIYLLLSMVVNIYPYRVVRDSALAFLKKRNQK